MARFQAAVCVALSILFTLAKQVRYISFYSNVSHLMICSSTFLNIFSPIFWLICFLTNGLPDGPRWYLRRTIGEEPFEDGGKDEEDEEDEETTAAAAEYMSTAALKLKLAQVIAPLQKSLH